MFSEKGDRTSELGEIGNLKHSDNDKDKLIRKDK